MESSKRTPSVIARLMGLDELPLQQPVQKQQRVLSEYYLQRVASIGVREKRPPHEHPPFRMSIEERKELSYIFRVLETLNRHKQHNPPAKRGKGSSNSSEEKLAFIRQGFLDAKCISEDKKLQNLTELQDATKTTYSKREPFSKYPRETDSSFAKLFHDRQDVPLDKCRKLGREAVQGNVKLLQKCGNGQNPHAKLGIGDICNFSRSQLESNSEEWHPQTKVVIWKPNHDKAENDARYFSSCSSCEGLPLGDRTLKEVRSTGKLDIKVNEGKNLAYGMKSNWQCLVDTEEDATKQTRHGSIWISPKVSRSESRVDSTFSKDSELMMPSDFSDRKNRYKFLFSFSHGSYVSRGAKKQILERWKLNKKFQMDGLVGRDSTLGEPLATAIDEIGTRNVHHKPSKYVLSNQTGPTDAHVNSGVLLGVANRDDSKYGSVRNFPKFTSPPASSSATGNPRTRTRYEGLQSDRYLGLERSINRAQQKLRNQNLNQKDGLGYKNISSYKKSHPIFCSDLEGNRIAEEMGLVVDEVKGQLDKDLSNQDFIGSQLSSSVSYSDMGNSCIVQDTWVVEGEMKHNLQKSNMSAQNILLPQPLVCSAASVSVVADVVAAAEGKVVNMASRPSGYSKEEQSESIPCILDTNSDSSSHASDTAIQQNPIPFISIASSLLNYPSLVSVLKPPCKEDLSCSLECLETVNTDDIYDFSEIRSEGPGMIVSSDEDSREGSVNDPEGNEGLLKLVRVEESRDFSYLTDVLTEAGFHDGIPDVDFATWHSPEYPMNLLVFETLEKRFGKQASWKRPERRLLFDRINSGLMEIFRPCMGVPKWAKPTSKRFKPRLTRDMIEEELWTLLISQEKEVSKDSTVRVLQKELSSLDLGDDIDVIGREIERLLIDELATEVISMDSF